MLIFTHMSDDDADGTDDDDDNDDDDDDDHDDGDDKVNRICCYQLRLSAVFSLHLFVNIKQLAMKWHENCCR